MERPTQQCNDIWKPFPITWSRQSPYTMTRIKYLLKVRASRAEGLAKGHCRAKQKIWWTRRVNSIKPDWKFSGRYKNVRFQSSSSDSFCRFKLHRLRDTPRSIRSAQPTQWNASSWLHYQPSSMNRHGDDQWGWVETSSWQGGGFSARLLWLQEPTWKERRVPLWSGLGSLCLTLETVCR